MDCPQTEILEQPGFFDRIKNSSKRIPLSGSLEVTFRCNLRCVHCYLGDNRSGVPGQQELTKEEIFGILDQVTEAGTLWFLLTGGEPFIRPDFMEIYRYAAHKGLLVTIFTNGTLLTPQIADELAELPPQLVEITLYGATQETYERVTGIPGSYQRCLRGIDLLLERKIPLKLKTIVMQWNKHEFEAIKAFAESKGVGFRYDASLVGAMNSGQGPFSQRLEPEEVVALERTNLQLQEELRAIMKRVAGQPVNQNLYQCGAAQNSYHIDPYGQLVPCILSRTDVFNLRVKSFVTGWEIFLGKIRSTPKGPVTRCDSCQLSVLCQQCPGKSYLETGQMEDPIEFFCKIGHLRSEMLNDHLSVSMEM